VSRNRALQIDIYLLTYLLTYLFAALTASRGDTKKTSVSQTDVAEEDHATFSSLNHSSVSCYNRHLQADQLAVYDSRVTLSCPDLSIVDDNDDQMSDITTAAVAAAAGYVVAKISRSFESLTSSTLADRVKSFNADYDRHARIGWQRHHCWLRVIKHWLTALYGHFRFITRSKRCWWSRMISKDTTGDCWRNIHLVITLSNAQLTVTSYHVQYNANIN